MIEFQIKGLKELQAALVEKPQKEGVNILRKALVDSSLVIETAMHANAPVETGFLAKHFGTKLSIKGGSELRGSGFVGPQGHVDYSLSGGGFTTKTNRKGKAYKSGRIAVASVARFIEFGTSKMQARPFMTKAFETMKERALYQIIRAIKEGLGL